MRKITDIQLFLLLEEDFFDAMTFGNAIKHLDQ